MRTTPLWLLALAALLAGTAMTACTSTAPSTVRRAPVRRQPPARRSSAPAPAQTAVQSFRGTLLTRTIPGLRSGFGARPALIYVPAGVRTRNAEELPVLELLHGTPGGPGQWVQQGGARASADAFAAAHNGLAPIIVMPDINGAGHGDTECVQSTPGNVETYLTVDVPNYVLAHFPASPDRRRWSIAGNSEGGTCALMLALRHSTSYGAFGDLSGLGRPTVGDHDERQQTIDALFAGSSYAYDRHDPLWLLAHHAYPELAGWLACGRGDRKVRLAQATVRSAATRAHLPVTARVLPGEHSWTVWTDAFRELLAWIWTQTSG